MQPLPVIPLDPSTLGRLVRSARDGDRQQLNALLTNVRPHLLAYFARRLSSDAAEDLTQIALLRIVRALPRIDADRADCYLAPVAQNLLRTASRRAARDRRRHAPAYCAERVIAGESADAELERQELADAVLRASVDVLPQALSTVVVALLHGRTTAEIARSHGVSQITVRTRLLRARALLRPHLASYVESDPGRALPLRQKDQRSAA